MQWAVRLRANDHGAPGALRAVYAARNSPLWVVANQPTPAALALLRTLEQADAYGLQPQDYDADGLAALAAGGQGDVTTVATAAGALTRNEVTDAQRWATFDVNLSAAGLKFICDLHYGRIDPRAAGFDLGTPRADDLDLTHQLVSLAAARDISPLLAAIEPQFLHYRLLEQALPRYRLLATSEPAAAANVRKIDLTLERWRWLPTFTTPPVIVNIPQFRLFAFRYGQDRRLERLLALAPVTKNRQLRQLTGSRATAATRASHMHRAE